jgi:hypothetical protein
VIWHVGQSSVAVVTVSDSSSSPFCDDVCWISIEGVSVVRTPNLRGVDTSGATSIASTARPTTPAPTTDVSQPLKPLKPMATSSPHVDVAA